MGKDNIIVEYTEFEETGISPAKSRFRKLAKEYFEFEIIKEKSSKLQLKEISRFANLQLPSELSEVFINYNRAPLFWAVQTPLSIYLEKFLQKSLANVGSLDEHREIKENYSKWLFAQSSEEKKRLAVFTIKLTEQNISKYNFYNSILNGVILTFEDSIFHPERAKELLSEAKDILSKLQITDEAQNEMLYILELYNGFVSLKLKSYEDAKLIFNNCLNIKPGGVTATFYLAYTELMLGNNYEAGYLLQIIWQYDLNRINYAIDQNNFLMFNQIMENLVFPNVFHFEEFSIIIEDIIYLIDNIKNLEEKSIDNLKEKTASFLLLKFESHDWEPFKKNISFIDKLLLSFDGRKNIYFLANIKNLENKFDYTLQQLINTIHAKYEKDIQEHVTVYEDEIKEKLTEIENMEAYLAELKSEIKNWQINETNSVEKKYGSEINEIQDRINSINSVVELNPLNSFSNTMTYNLFMSFVVFMIGVFTSYLNNSSSYGDGVSNYFSNIISGGFKWGLICYVIGSLIAAAIAGTVILERSNVRQRFMKRIRSLKIYREQELEYIKLKAKNEEDDAIKNISKKKITQLNKRIENLRNTKSQQEEILRKEGEEKFKKETEIFQPFLKVDQNK